MMQTSTSQSRQNPDSHYLPMSGSRHNREAEIRDRLRALEAEFVANVDAASRDFSKLIADEQGLDGLSAHDKARAKRQAKLAGQDGYLLTLGKEDYAAVANYAHDRALRKAMYEAYFTRASDHGPRKGHFDNTPLLIEILDLKLELARVLGFDSYARYTLEGGPIEDPFAAEAFLVKLHRSTRTKAQTELDTLWAFAKEKGAPRGFSPWDLHYYAEWYSREVLEVDDAALRAYFELGDVIIGALRLCVGLFGIHFDPADTNASLPKSHSYTIRDDGGQALARLQLSPYADSDDLGEARIALAEDTNEDCPVITISAGLEAPLASEPVLLRHAEVERLFRAIGRCVFLVLRRSTEGRLALTHDHEVGSQVSAAFLARFATHYDTLTTFAIHYQTRTPLSRELFQQIVKRKDAHENLWKAYALDLTLFDLRIHRDYVEAKQSTQLRSQIQDAFIQVRREQAVLPPSYWTRLAQTSCSLFAHGQGARLWEVDWATHQAAELFAHFEASGMSSSIRARYLDAFWGPGEAKVTERLALALGTTSDSVRGAALAQAH